MIKITENLARVLLGVNPISISKGKLENTDIYNILSFSEQEGKDIRSVLISFPDSESIDLLIGKLKEIKKDVKKLERRNNKRNEKL